MEKHNTIYVAGHRGLVGSAIVRKLTVQGFERLILKTHAELDLLDQGAVEHFFQTEKPDYVFLAAAKVGGILANRDHPADFIYENLVIETNVIHSAYKNGVKKLIFLGSSCIYPREAPQPLREEYFLSGLLEPTNQAYAIAKIAGITLCQSYHRQYGVNFISVMPTNLYGLHDNFDLEHSHVIPAMIRKFHEAKTANAPSVTLWGSGTARREFLAVDDLADALLFLMERYNSPELINIGTGNDITIHELAEMVKQVTDFQGEIQYDRSKPDGTPRKLLDISKIEKFGWHPAISLRDGIQQLYTWYRKNTSI